MAHNVKITVNGDVWMDGNPGEWIARDPQWVAKRMAPNTGHTEPWRMPLVAIFADACRNNTNTTITLTTKPHSWTLKVAEDAPHR